MQCTELAKLSYTPFGCFSRQLDYLSRQLGYLSRQPEWRTLFYEDPQCSRAWCARRHVIRGASTLCRVRRRCRIVWYRRRGDSAIGEGIRALSILNV